MWKCSRCGTDNELLFCTKCGGDKKKNEVKYPTPKEGRWKCSRCDKEIGGNFCSKCRMARTENDAWKSMQEESMLDQQMLDQPSPVPSTIQLPTIEEKSSKKGVIIAIVVIVAVIALLVTMISFAIRLIMNSESGTGGYAEPAIEIRVDGIPQMDGPFNYDVWTDGEVVQVEGEGAVLNIPLPLDTIMREVEIEGSSLWLSQGEGGEWFRIGVLLIGEKRDELSHYSDYEVTRALDWHNDYGQVLNHSVYREDNATLLIIQWEDEYGEGITFTKVSQYQEFILMTEVAFDTTGLREDFFQVYGFNEYFGSIIRDYGD